MTKIEVVQTIAIGLDIFALLVVFALGTFAVLRPIKFWKLTQNRRNKDLEPTDKATRSTKLIGMLAVGFSIVVLIITIKPLL